MQSFRSRMGSVLRRGSFSKDSEHSGNESEQRPPSPNPRKSSDTGSMRLKRKRLSLSFRNRSGTNDTLEHAQMAQQVVADIEAQKAQQQQHETDDKKDHQHEAVAASSSVDATTDDTKIESPVEAAKVTDKVQDDGECKHEETATPAVAEGPASEQTREIAVAAPLAVEETLITHEVDTRVPEPSMWATSHPRVEGLEESYHVIMRDSPPQPTRNLPVVDVTPSFPESTPYETSFSSASAASPDVSYTSPTPLTMPVPHHYPSGHQPLSAIDEDHAKVHPLAAQEQEQVVSQTKDKQQAAVETQPSKEDVNYDADEPLQQYGSTLNLRPTSLSLDLKGKGRVDPRSPPLFETLGWTEYILPDTTFYFALHMPSPTSPQHLKMPSPIAAAAAPPTVTVVADYDLRNQQILKRVCEEMRTLIRMEMPITTTTGPTLLDRGRDSNSNNNYNWELWLHRPLGYIPSHLDATRPPIVHTWVDHAKRMLAPRPYGAVDLPPNREDGADAVTLVNGYGGKASTSSPVVAAGVSSSLTLSTETVESDRDRLSKELAYWAFVERHPAHGILGDVARREALEGLTWSYADRLVQNGPVLPSPFTQEECQSLLRLLDRQGSLSMDQDRLIVNRMIASVHSRLVTYRIASLDASQSAEIIKKDGKSTESTTMVFPFRRAIFGFLSAIVCWGIPYLFLEDPSRDSNAWARFQPLDGNAQVLNPGRGMYYSGTHQNLAAERRTSAMIYGAGVSVTAAVVIGSATTLLTLRPALDSPARTASFVALICAGASLAAGLISLARLSRVSRMGTSSYSAYPPHSELFFPGVKRDTESQVVLN
ncbi:hypothetical protein FRC17_011331, partial [Serendipita sp. 399]